MRALILIIISHRTVWVRYPERENYHQKDVPKTEADIGVADIPAAEAQADKAPADTSQADKASGA